jgi:DNA adenine methylase
VGEHSLVTEAVKGPSAARSFLRWAGSKRSLLSHLHAKFPARYERYVEPFAGSACLYFHANPKVAILSDLNDELIDAYRAVKGNAAAVSNALEKLPVGKDAYYLIREIEPLNLDIPERAARFIYLNRFCFNGLYRTNLRGQFNVPYGAPKNFNIPSQEALSQCSRRLANADLRSGDFEKSIGGDIIATDFYYFDPPYCQRGKRIFREYHPDSFSITDVRRLVDILGRIDDAGAKFMVSYADNPEAKDAFSRWNVTTVNAQRNISGFAKHRRLAQELVVINY